jgi:hypothetical protein
VIAVMNGISVECDVFIQNIERISAFIKSLWIIKGLVEHQAYDENDDDISKFTRG